MLACRPRLAAMISQQVSSRQGVYPGCKAAALTLRSSLESEVKMKKLLSHRFNLATLATSSIVLLIANGPAHAASQPAQEPLLTTVVGAKPNLVLVIDNSGSMDWNFVVDPDFSRVISSCSSGREPYIYLGGSTTSGQSYSRFYCRGGNSLYTPSFTSNSGLAQRSPDVLDLYYDPRVRYEMRVNSDRTARADNRNYPMLENGTGVYSVDNRNTVANSGNSPYHRINRSDAVFSSWLCTTPACTAYTEHKVVWNASTTYTKHPGRSDCAGNVCTTAEEWKNISIWYAHHSTRMRAATTAIGAALSNPDYDDRFRMGYGWINPTSEGLTRGVRVFSNKASVVADRKQAIYDAFYTEIPTGGTPLHNAIDKVASYYGNSRSPSPWLTNPTLPHDAKTNPELSCRRSFNILFSDGAWNAGTSNYSTDQDNTASSSYNINYTDADGKAVSRTFRYNPRGDSDRSLYTPYPSPATTGLADLTARYYWHTDFRPDTDNNIPLRLRQSVDDLEPSNPVNRQNMTTYTVGFGILPTGDLPSTAAAYRSDGLRMADIERYQKEYYRTGSISNPPAWYTSNNPALNSSWASDQSRVDDFIHAGYTGGGFGAGVKNSQELKELFSRIIYGILNATGTDAGVAASGSSMDSDASTDALRYLTEYKTSDNTGDVRAYNIMANPSAASPVWSARRALAAQGATSRKLYTFHNGAGVALHEGGTTVASPPAAVRSELDPTNFFSSSDGSQVVKYLLGDDTVKSASGDVLRRRPSLIGASVNSPPLLTWSLRNMGYTVNSSTVGGKDIYDTYRTDKTSYPPTLYSANNDGMVHVLNAAKVTDTQTGETILPNVKAGAEVAAFVPLGVGGKLHKLANRDYSFEYVLDGPLYDHDVHDGTKWRQLIVGSSGRALADAQDKGRFLYALDAPFKGSGENEVKNRIPTKEHFLWERGWSDLGHVTNLTRSGQLSENSEKSANQWAVLSNSGHYTSLGKAGLYVLDALTGAELGFIATTESVDVGRGLSGITVLRDGNQRIVAAYAGDAKGNVWRFSLGAKWEAHLLFTTENNRPIYGAPALQPAAGGRSDKGNCNTSLLDGQCGVMVVVGTGMALDETDMTDAAADVKQAIYGYWDPTPVNAEQTGIHRPIGQTWLVQTIDVASQNSSREVPLLDNMYKRSNNSINYQSEHLGWRLMVGAVPGAERGERFIADVFNLGRSVVLFSTVIQPQNDALESCEASSSPSLVYVLQAKNGGEVAAFKTTAGKVVPYSVGFIGIGGFARGNQLIDVSAKNQKDSIASMGEPNSPVFDPTQKMGNCIDTDGKAVGTSGGFDLTVVCPLQGWNRSWRQILTPPAV